MKIYNAEITIKSEWCSAAESMFTESAGYADSVPSTAHTHASASLAFAKYLRALVDFRFLARPATAEPPTTFKMVKISLPGPSNPARNVLTGYLGSCYSQPEKGPWLYLHCTSSTLRRECANIREIFNRILTQSARRPTPVRISIRTPA